jgi:hypothetical protein
LTSCELTPLGTDLTGVDPLLAPLADNGGRSETLALGAASPARDAGNPAIPGSGGLACEFDDQRAVARPLGAVCDIGAFEADLVPTPTPTETPAASATPSPTETATPPAETTTPSATETAQPPTETAAPSATPTATPAGATSTPTPAATTSPASGCSAAPMNGCRPPSSPNASTLVIVDAVRASSDTLTWTWTKGTTTPKLDFGDPLATTGYALCVYDGANARVVQAQAAPGGVCGTKPCWKSARRGFAYTRKLGAPDGIDRIALTEGLVDGKAKIVVHAKGTHVVLPTLPVTLPLRVQLQSTTGACWEAAFATATKNEARRFKGRGQ